MTSKALYAFDGVLPLRYMILIGQAYLRNGGVCNYVYTTTD